MAVATVQGMDRCSPEGFFCHPSSTCGRLFVDLGWPWSLWDHKMFPNETEGSDLCDLGTTFGHPCITFGHPWCPFSYLVPTLGRALKPLGHLLEKASKKVPKIREMGIPKWTHFQWYLHFLRQVIQCVWTAQAQADWGSGHSFSIFIWKPREVICVTLGLHLGTSVLQALRE